MVYTALGIIVAPGGLGTMDELFELLTLLQTGKTNLQKIPIVLLGKQYWNTIVNFEALRDFGVAAQSDIDRLFITDSVDDAFEHVTARLVDIENTEEEYEFERP
jgi:predicted Rossmann-fold nucleotide-binding protein